MNGKSGKLVAPAVAFMLCAVALVGVGFGINLNSTSTAETNTVNVNGLVLDLTGPQNEAIITGTAAVYYDTVQTGVNGDITYNFAKENMTIAAGKVNIESPGNVTLTYTVKNVKVNFSDGSFVTVTPKLNMVSSEMVESGGVYTLSKSMSLDGNEAVKTGVDNFTIKLDGTGDTPTSIGVKSHTIRPTTITYTLSVSAVYSTA